MNVLVLDTLEIAAENTGSGNQVIRWGLAQGLGPRVDRADWLWICRGDRPQKLATLQRSVQALGDLGWNAEIAIAPDRASAAAAVRTVLADRRPEVVLVYGSSGADLYRTCGSRVPFGVMSVDLEHLPPIHRFAFRMKYGSLMERLRAIKRAPRTFAESAQAFLRISGDHSGAAFILNHAAMHAEWLRRRTGLPTLYTPNPVALCPPPVRVPDAPDGVPRFMLLGGMGGIATLSGLGFLASAVIPHLADALGRGDLEIHSIGKGEFPKRIEAVFRDAGVVQQGFVPDLDLALADARAVLVPTPIPLGFRTRILDCFRQGICVIAHSANAAGMPELAHDRNALLAKDGREFAQQVLRLMREPETAERLADQARKDFETYLSAEQTCGTIIEFIKTVTSTKKSAERMQ